jgi:hypothetical protein
MSTPPSLGARQHLQDPAVQPPAAKRRQRALDRLPEQLVAEPDRLLFYDQQSGLGAALHCRRLRSQGLLQQPQLGPCRDHGHQPHDLLGVRWQAGKAGEHQVPDRGWHAGLARREHLGDQQRVPAGQRAQPGDRAAGPARQLRHRRLGQWQQPQVAYRLRGQPADDRTERMVDRQLVVAVADDQQRPCPLHPPPQEHQQVQSRLVRPVGVLDHHKLWARRLVQLIQERREQLLPRPPRDEQLGQPAARLPGDVVQRAKRPGREQRITSAEEEPSIRPMPLGELLDQCRLADAGLARHQGDEAAGRRLGEYAIQRRVKACQLSLPANQRRRRGP